MQFPNPITRLIRISYADGTTAVQIGPGPTADFRGQTGAELVIDANGNGAGIPTIYFWNVHHDNAGYINVFGGGSEANLGVNGGGYPSLRYPTMLFCQTTLLLTTQNRDGQLGPHQQITPQIFYSGNLVANEQGSAARLLDSSGNILAQAGTRDMATSGTPVPIAQVLVGNLGTYTDTSSVQIKETINGVSPVQWTSARRWLEISGFDWTALTLLNGWTASSTYYVPAVKMSPDGMVMFRGTMQGGIVTDNTQVFNLPGGGTAWCPSASVLLRPATSTGNANHRLLVNATGMGFIYGTAASAQLGLDGLQYSCIRP